MENTKNNGNPVTRRSFLKGLGSAGIAGALTTLSGCKSAGKPSGGEGWTPQQYNAPGSWPVQVRGRVPIDPNNPSIVRDDRKCILCGQCAEACERIQSVEGFYELPIKDDITCVNCGQCALWCPTGAISERDDIDRVLTVIKDEKLHVIVAKKVRVAILFRAFMLPQHGQMDQPFAVHGVAGQLLTELFGLPCGIELSREGLKFALQSSDFLFQIQKQG